MGIFIKQFTKYYNSVDETKIPKGGIARGSKNCEVLKGSVYSVKGNVSAYKIDNNNNPIHSSYTFNTLYQELPLRAFDTILQVKLGDIFVDLLTTLSGAEIWFDFWIDSQVQTNVKRRLVFVDNSNNLYVWNGSNFIVNSITSGNVNPTGNISLWKLGFDYKSGVNINVFVYRNGARVAGEFSYNNNVSSQNYLTLTNSNLIQAGDVIVIAPYQFSNISSGVANIIPQVCRVFSNHLFLFNSESNYVPYSDASIFDIQTGFNFIPPATNQTPLSAGSYILNYNFTAVVLRTQSSTTEKLAISDGYYWHFINFSTTSVAGVFIQVYKFDAGFQKGSKYMATEVFNGGIVYLALDNRIYYLSYNELGNLDVLDNISDDVENYFLNDVDNSFCRIYFIGRRIFFIFKNSNQYIVFDTVEKHWQPPRELNISTLQVFDGKLYGNDNTKVDTYEMFVGSTDRGNKYNTDIVSGFFNLDDSIGDIQQYTFGGKTTAKQVFTFLANYVTNINITIYRDNDFNPTQNNFSTSAFNINPKYKVNQTETFEDSFGSNQFGDEILGGRVDNLDLLQRARAFFKFSQDVIIFFNIQFKISADNTFQLLSYCDNMSVSPSNENQEGLWVVPTTK